MATVCTGHTKKGEPCKKRTTKPSGFCYIHETIKTVNISLNLSSDCDKSLHSLIETALTPRSSFSCISTQTDPIRIVKKRKNNKKK